jgi:hypothetical protein
LHLAAAQVQRDGFFASVEQDADSVVAALAQNDPGIALQAQFWAALFSKNGKTNPLAAYHLNITVTHLRRPVST